MAPCTRRPMAAAGEPADDRIDDGGMVNPSDRDDGEMLNRSDREDGGERWIRGDGDRLQVEGPLGPSV